MKQSLFLATGLLLGGASLHAGVFAFEADSAGVFTSDGGFPIVNVHIDHPTVTAAPFAFSSLEADQTVDLSGAPPPIDGHFTFTQAGGDTLFGTYLGVVNPGSNPNQLVAPGTFEFTGGTGAFAGAWGGGSLYAVIDFTGPNGGVSTIEWRGQLNTVPEPASCALMAGLLLAGFALWRRPVSKI